MFVPSSTSSLFCIEAEVQLIIRRLADAAAVPAKVGHHTVLPVDQRPHPLGPAVFRAQELVPQHDAGLCRRNAAGRADDGTTSHWYILPCTAQPARAPSATSPHVTCSCDPRRVGHRGRCRSESAGDVGGQGAAGVQLPEQGAQNRIAHVRDIDSQ